MKDLKFRLYSKNEKCFITASSGLKLNLNGQIYCDGLNVTDRYVIEQYTGLKDKNERGIYEGDIVSVNSVSGNEAFTGVIKFGYFLSHSDDPVGLYGWAISSLDGKQYSLGECFEMQLTVIGNIQEAPESLTETKVSQ